MYGLLSFEEKNDRRQAVACSVRQICGMRFFQVAVRCSGYGFLEKKRLKKAAKMMHKAGVRRVLFPEGFSDAELFGAFGITAADGGYLRAMTAAEIARRVVAEHGLNPREICVGISGEHMGADVRKALMSLALGVRYTVLDLPGGGEEACSVLRREYGISVLKADRQRQLRLPDVLLTFGDAKPWGGENCLWIPCGTCRAWAGYHNAAPKVRYSVPPEIEEQLPENCSANGLLSLLLEAGIVHENELEVSEIL